MEGVHIGHNVKIGNYVTVANKSGLAGYCEVGDFANLGGMVGVHQFTKIGKLCMVGGLSKVVKDIPPFTLADGRPARIYGINKVGLQRAGFNAMQRKQIKEIYKKLYHDNLPLRQAVEMIRKENIDDAIVAEVVKFFDNSQRGLAPWPQGHVSFGDVGE
jgi:UDP-N-acetylglucosamine acyltransferase